MATGNPMLLIEQQRLWLAPGSKHCYQQNAAPAHGLRTSSCVASQVETWKEEKMEDSVRAQPWQQELSGWDCWQDKNTSRFPGFKESSMEVSQAVDALDVLVQRGARVSSSLVYAVLKRCLAQKNLVLGQRVHALTIQSGHESNRFLTNNLLRMYASHGKLQEATDVFTKVAQPDAFTWSAIILAYAEHGEPKQAIQLYQKMRSSSVKPDSHVFTAALKACARALDLESGKQVHADVLERWRGSQPDVFVGSCLLDMYAKCGRLGEARRVFDSLPTRNVVTWTSMIAGYAEHGHGREALALYARIQAEGTILANDVTFACLLKACASTGATQQGKKLHLQILERGLEANVLISNCLVDMYVKCGSLDDARRVFDGMCTRDVVTWTAMIAGYTEHGLCEEALALYARMESEDMISANDYTFACLLKACANSGSIQQGKQLHKQILERGLKVDLVIGNCLVDMYGKCGSLDDARRVFDNLPTKNVVTWSSMINGYTDNGLGQEALSLYAQMEWEGIFPNDVIFLCLLKACASSGAIKHGKQLHAQILNTGVEVDLLLGNSLVDMYAKCGNLEEARSVFDSMADKDVVTWTTMLNGFGQSDQGQKAIQCFREMLQDGVEPNETTFICLLVACSHEGLVSEGRQYFKSMMEDHSIAPSRQHYVCMVDLLGRSGCLVEAEKMLLSMPFETDVAGWVSLLTACRSHRDVDRGRRCFESLIQLDPQNASAYVLMANIYADAGMWTDVDRVESLRRAVGAIKRPGKAGIEVNMRVQTFFVGKERDDIAFNLRSMNAKLKEKGGHVPQTELVLKPLSEKGKEDALCGHAEKLALAYGLLNTPDGTSLLVTKNLRMCGDCHTATRILSRIEKREIIVRDAHRVHRFVEGSCSCGDRP